MGKALSSLKNDDQDKKNYMKYFGNFDNNLNSQIKQENSKYIILMRHGDRQDCDDIPQVIPSRDDPELSEIGMKQATDIGYQLKFLLLNKNFSEINIFTSPYTRTIMTSIFTANAFDINDKINKNIYVIKDLSENDVKGGFEKNIDDAPIYYHKEKEKEKKDLYNKFIYKYIKGKKYNFIDYDFESLLQEIEDKEEIITKRFFNVAQNLYNYISLRNKNNENILNLIVTHQYGVQFMIKKLLEFLENKIELTKKNDYYFCCSYCFKINHEKKFIYLGQLKPNILRYDSLIIKNEEGKIIDIKKRNNRFLIITRHGERIDNTDFRKNQELPKYDPELTLEGIYQATSIGIQLRNLLRYEYNIEINEINIFNSPSIRTMMTGILIGGVLDYYDKCEKVIRVITDLNETSVEGGFENNKDESPIFYYKDKDQDLKKLYEKYIISLTKNRNFRFSNFDFSSILGKNGLEDGEEMEKRAENVITNIKGFIETTYTFENNTISIVSTHQLNVSMIVAFLIKQINKSNKENGIEEIILKDQHFGYCDSYCFKINGDEEFSYLGLIKPKIDQDFEYELIV